MTELMNLKLEPVRQIVAVGESAADGSRRWRSGGNDPVFSCRWPQECGISLPGGWYVINLSLSLYKGRVHNMRLYPSYGLGSAVEADSVPLAANVIDGSVKQVRNGLVRFVRDVNALRFDPSVMPCDFTLSPVTFRRAGRVEALRLMLQDAWSSVGGLVPAMTLLARTARDFARGGVSRMAERLYSDYTRRRVSDTITDYSTWIEFFDPPEDAQVEQAEHDQLTPSDTPLFSIVVPVYNTPEKWLRRCLDSVIAQRYANWELCIADDASDRPQVAAVLREYAARDSRIKLAFRAENGHISAASNTAIELATGRYIALLDHDDELHPRALLECAKAFVDNPGWRMLFTDEDKIDEQGVRSDPYFKSDWNPDLFLSQNCVCHLTVYERELVTNVGGFREGLEGAQDWDLTLKIVELLDHAQIGHVAKVLYHWRMIAGSTALAPGEKSYAHLAAMRAVQEHFDRTQTPATVCEMLGYSGYYRIEYHIPSPEPLVSILIPTRDRVDLLEQCIRSITARTDYHNYEIIIVDNGSREARTLEYFSTFDGDDRIRVIQYDQPFNYSALNNYGASHANGSVIALLNNDIEVITPGWLREMVSHAMRPEIGVVGAMLYYPDDTIQHAGVFLGFGGVAGHAYVGRPRGYPGDKHRAGLAQSLSAVTAACAVLRRAVFDEIGGLDEGLQVAFNDVDLCLRATKHGYRNLWTPYAELYHHESASRGYEDTPEKISRFKREEQFMKDRWGAALEYDPYYNTNFTLTDTPFTLAYPPR